MDAKTRKKKVTADSQLFFTQAKIKNLGKNEGQVVATRIGPEGIRVPRAGEDTGVVEEEQIQG